MPDLNRNKDREEKNAPDITEVINSQLKSKGISARYQVKDDCLQVLLESSELPSKEASKSFIQNILTGQNLSGIRKVKLYGRRKGDKQPAWKDELDVFEQSSRDPLSLPDKVSDELPKSSFKTTSSSVKVLKKKKASPLQKILKENKVIFGLLILSLCFAAWLVTSKGYQSTLEEMSYSKAFRQLINSFFNSPPSANRNSNTVIEDLPVHAKLAAIEVGHRNPPEDLIEAFNIRLTEIDEICPENREELADLLVWAQSELAGVGHHESLYAYSDGILTGAPSVIEAYGDGTGCTEFMAGMVTVLKAQYE